MAKKIIITQKTISPPTLADLMKDDIPFGQCGYQAIHSFNNNYGAISTAVIDYLFILFADGTPNHPLNIVEGFDGGENDPRILMFMTALSEYENREGEVHKHIFLFIALYFAYLGIPMDGLRPEGKKKTRAIKKVEAKRKEKAKKVEARRERAKSGEEKT